MRKRELMDIGAGKLYVRRDQDDRFKERSAYRELFCPAGRIFAQPFSLVCCAVHIDIIASAQIAASDERRIQAAVMLDGLAEPIVGEAHCRVDKRCEIISGLGSGVKVDVNWRRRGTVESADLTIQCPKDCSFTSGRSKVTFQSERKFDLFRGAENHVEIKPVLRPRIKIGQIFLIVE